MCQLLWTPEGLLALILYLILEWGLCSRLETNKKLLDYVYKTESNSESSQRTFLPQICWVNISGIKTTTTKKINISAFLLQYKMREARKHGTNPDGTQCP